MPLGTCNPHTEPQEYATWTGMQEYRENIASDVKIRPLISLETMKEPTLHQDHSRN